MKCGTKIVGAAIAAITLMACASRTQAATITLLGDTGSVRVLTPTLFTSVTVAAPYGTPPIPAITQTSATSYEINFSPTADFHATAYSLPTGQTTTFDGSLDFVAVFSTAIKLTANIYEDGVYTVGGAGTVSATGGVTVTAVDPVTFVNAGEFLGNSFASAILNSNGTWTAFDQVTGFANEYMAYKIHVDNLLVAQSLFSTPSADGSAYIAKKDFRLVLTTDGSGGPNVPEPASLSLVAVGTLALLARRRRA